jgi:hypothetical protein
VPGLKEIGMFGPRVQEALAKMGVLGFHEVDEEALRALDDKAAVDALTEREMAFRHRDIEQVADLGSAAPSDGTPAP